MKPYLYLSLLVALAVSGCGKAPGGNTSDKSQAAPAAKTETPPAPVAPVAFTPDTHGLVSPEEVPLLEQINRENTQVTSAALPSIVRISATHPEDPRMELFGKQLPF